MFSNGNLMSPDDITKFSLEIEEAVYMKDISYIEAIVDYCDNTGLEVESAAKLISGVLKSKVEKEAQNLHLLPKPTTMSLPI